MKLFFLKSGTTWNFLFNNRESKYKYFLGQILDFAYVYPCCVTQLRSNAKQSKVQLCALYMLYVTINWISMRRIISYLYFTDFLCSIDIHVFFKCWELFINVWFLVLMLNSTWGLWNFIHINNFENAFV